MRLTEEVQRATRTANERARVSATDAATSAAKAAGYDAVKSERDELLRGMTPLEMAARDVARVNAKLTQKLVDVRYLAASLTYDREEEEEEEADARRRNSVNSVASPPPPSTTTTRRISASSALGMDDTHARSVVKSTSSGYMTTTVVAKKKIATAPTPALRRRAPTPTPALRRRAPTPTPTLARPRLASASADRPRVGSAASWGAVPSTTPPAATSSRRGDVKPGVGLSKRAPVRVASLAPPSASSRRRQPPPPSAGDDGLRRARFNRKPGIPSTSTRGGMGTSVSATGGGFEYASAKTYGASPGAQVKSVYGSGSAAGPRRADLARFDALELDGDTPPRAPAEKNIVPNIRPPPEVDPGPGGGDPGMRRLDASLRGEFDALRAEYGDLLRKTTSGGAGVGDLARSLEDVIARLEEKSAQIAGLQRIR